MAFYAPFIFMYIISVTFAVQHEEIVRQAQIELNRRGGRWQADINPDFVGRNTDDLSVMSGTVEDESVHTKQTFRQPTRTPIGRHGPQPSQSQNLPEHFDWRHHTDCQSFSQIRNQKKCGDCWAVSSSSVMSDRYCLWTNRDVYLSAKNLVTCVFKNQNKCAGNNPANAMEYAVTQGITTGGDPSVPEELPGCLPYPMHVSELNTSCPYYCDNNSPISEKYYKGGDYFAIKAKNNEEALSSQHQHRIMEEIYRHGSVVGSIKVYEDLHAYKSGIYHHVTGAAKGHHAIRIIGWGVEDGTKFWWVANSWNKKHFGLNGYMKFLRGENECGIERKIFSIFPPEAYD